MSASKVISSTKFKLVLGGPLIGKSGPAHKDLEPVNSLTSPGPKTAPPYNPNKTLSSLLLHH